MVGAVYSSQGRKTRQVGDATESRRVIGPHMEREQWDMEGGMSLHMFSKDSPRRIYILLAQSE